MASHRYHAIPGRANNYQAPPTIIQESTSPKKRTRTITVPDRDLQKIAARLQASSTILKMDLSPSERTEILETLGLGNDAFDAAIMLLIIREETKEKLAYWRKQLLT